MGSLSDTLAVITENLKAIVHSFNARKLLSSIIIGILFIGILVMAGNYFTGFLYFNRMNKKIDVLERVENKSDDQRFQERIDSVYSDLLIELHSFKTKKDLHIDKNSKGFGILVRVLVSLIVPVLILLTSIGNPGFKDTFVGALIFMIVFGFFAALLPTIHTLWLTSIIIVVAEVLILLIVVKLT